MAITDLRRIPLRGSHRPHGSSWALTRGMLHALAPDPSSPGPLRGLEREAGFHLQAAHAVAFGGAPTALELLLGSLGLTPGAQVLIPALAPAWVPVAIQRAGLRPGFVDVAPDSLHMDPQRLEAAIGPATAAVLVAHTAGIPCDLDAIRRAAGRLPLLELFGMALGARWRSRPVGALTLAGVADLEAGQLSTFGGALVVTDDTPLTARLRGRLAGLSEPGTRAVASQLTRAHLDAVLAHPSAFTLLGWARPDRTTAEPMVPTALHPAQAEAARTAFAVLDAQLDTCRERAAELRWALPAEAWRQAVPDGALPVWSQLLVRSHDPQACTTAARRRGVQLDPCPLGDISDGACPHAARAAAECVALPCHRHLRPADLSRIGAAVKDWLI
jgi:hypothetical protein